MDPIRKLTGIDPAVDLPLRVQRSNERQRHERSSQEDQFDFHEESSEERPAEDAPEPKPVPKPPPPPSDEGGLDLSA